MKPENTIDILYKYYSEHFDVIDHLQNPAIKLATTGSLNDPFERNLPNDLAYELSDKLIKKENIQDRKLLTRKLFRDQFREISKAYGVVSLTENNKNILMWAHYSSSHKGVCIGYKSSMFQKIKEKQLEMDGALKGEYLPREVKYSAKRLEIENHNKYEIHDLIMNSMCTKSIHWKYENEHRSIIPLSWSDKFTLSQEANKRLSSMISDLSKKGIIEKSIANENNTITHHFRKYEDQLADTDLKIGLAENQDLIMLKNIDLENVSEIYLGATFCDHKVDAIRDFINSSPERYGHISAYKYRLNFNEFSLDIMPLENSKKIVSLSNLIVETDLDLHGENPKTNILDLTDR